ncbi:MAG: hypothetical protein EP343_13505 [Deltaproteobacteria bacterium]|nr:MAG: hypothetical protein EP343_13505 [Deltaproteobacteria bacterium]
MRSHTSQSTKVTPLPSTKKTSRLSEQSLRPDLWDSRYNAREIETLKVVAHQYSLDPLMREVIMLHGNIYVTAAGLQKLAQRDPDYNGCQIEPIVMDWENNFFVVKASVWKKGCDYPFEDFGDADPTTSKLRGKALFRHAITRARARAIRSAFAVPFCALEELDDETRWKAAQNETPSYESKSSRRSTPQRSSYRPTNAPAANRSLQPPRKAQPVEPQAPVKSVTEQPTASASKEASSNAPKITDLATTHQHKMLERYISQLGWGEPQINRYLKDAFSIESLPGINRMQASNMLDHLAERLKEMSKEASSETKPNKPTRSPKVKAATPAKEVAPEAKKAAAPSKPIQEQKGLDDDAPAPSKKSKSPKWSDEEQQRIAEDLLGRMQRAGSLSDLRQEWQMFQGLRHKLSEQWTEQIRDTKDQRKAALSA